MFSKFQMFLSRNENTKYSYVYETPKQFRKIRKHIIPCIVGVTCKNTKTYYRVLSALRAKIRKHIIPVLSALRAKIRKHIIPCIVGVTCKNTKTYYPCIVGVTCKNTKTYYPCIVGVTCNVYL